MRHFTLAAWLAFGCMAARADYMWDFTRNLEDWSAKTEEAWGAKGCALSWEARTADDGMAVFTMDGGAYPDGLEARMYQFYWSGYLWNAADITRTGGPAGKYFLVRYRVTGTMWPDTAPAEDRGYMAYTVDLFEADVSNPTRAFGRPAMETTGVRSTGPWVTAVFEMAPGLPGTVDRVTVQLASASQHSERLFPDAGDRIEIDWVRLVDDPTPYLIAQFDENRWPWGYFQDFQTLEVSNGQLRGALEDSDPPPPRLWNDFVFLRSFGSAPDTYLNLAYSVQCASQPCGLDAVPVQVAYREEASETGDGNVLDISIPVGIGQVANLPLHDSPGWGTGTAWSYITGTWSLRLGYDLQAAQVPPALAGATIAFDWVSFSPTPQATPPVFVPDCFGLTPAEAAIRLAEVGLAAGATTETRTVQTEVGNVLRTAPPAGGFAFQGDAVDFVLSSGPLPEAERAVPDALRTREDGTLELHGERLQAVGINFFSMFSRTLADPTDTSYVDGLQVLADHGIPFVRFMASGFWPVNMAYYVHNKEAYFALLDDVVAAAEDKRIGLIPSVCWYDACIPDIMGEPRNAWGDPASKTVAFMRRYTEELVLRYRNSPAIWAWELGNEYNLALDLPNADSHRPPTHPSLGTLDSRGPDDDVFHDMYVSAFEQFGQVVRSFDSTHPVTTGNSAPRPSQYHQRIELSWTQDSRAEYQQTLIDLTPDPLDMVSFHYYPGSAGSRFDEGIPALSEMLALTADAAHTAGRACFLGEFGHSGEEGDAAEVAARFGETLADVASSDVDLAAVWVFDLPMQGNSWDINATNDRAYMLESVGRANDTDRDGLSNYAEVQGESGYTTDPYDADSDDGGVPDGEEVLRGTNPLDPADDNAHDADLNRNGVIELAELLRFIQLYQGDGYHCAQSTDDGYAPGSGDTACDRHDGDYGEQPWVVGLSEVLRLVQFHQAGGYQRCTDGSSMDGFCLPSM